MTHHSRVKAFETLNYVSLFLTACTLMALNLRGGRGGRGEGGGGGRMGGGGGRGRRGEGEERGGGE